MQEAMDISIHTPTKGVTRLERNRRSLQIFQSTLPRREWRDFSSYLVFLFEFQSTLPRREWLSLCRSIPYCCWFQSTLPRREWLTVIKFFWLLHLFQSTLPRREWLCSWLLIHVSFYFNPHSHEGSDPEGETIPRHIKNFNPHSHEGSDVTFR